MRPTMGKLTTHVLDTMNGCPAVSGALNTSAMRVVSKLRPMRVLA